MNKRSTTLIEDVRKEVLAAEPRIRKHIRETPLDYSPYLSRLGGCSVYLKLENLQITGSFKLRGAANKFLSLDREAWEKGVITASSGNHGAAAAYLFTTFGWKGVIYLPENASPAKVETLRTYGADLEFYGTDGIMSETLAKETARKTGREFISPYADMKIIGGQGTVAHELFSQLEKIDAVFVPVGGGGLISGIGGYLKTVNGDIEVIGCQPENSCVMYESVRAGKIVDIESLPTISDGTAGGIEPGAVTFDICRECVDDFVLCTECEIEDAIRLVLEKHYLLIEGAAALQVAAFIKTKERFANKNVILIISGSKIGLKTLKDVLCDAG